MLRERPRRSPVRLGATLGVAAVVVVALLPLARGVAGFLGWFDNPFDTTREEQVERTVVLALADADELHAATADLQVVVRSEEDTRYLPDVVAGRDTTLLVTGTVDAVVDLGAAVVEEGEDGAVTVTLPAPHLSAPNVDRSRSEVVERDRGVLDRLSDAVGEPSDDDPLYALAETALRDAAADSEVLARAGASARSTVERLLEEAGVDDVTVVFAEPAGADA